MITTPKLRADLQSAPVEDADGVLYYDISDPKSGGVLRLFDFEWQLAQRFDGQRGLDELTRWTEEQLGFAATRDDLQVYAERLQQLGLVEGAAGAARPLPGALVASAMLRSLGLLPAAEAAPSTAAPVSAIAPVAVAPPAAAPAKPVEPVAAVAKPVEAPKPIAPVVQKPIEPPRRVSRDEDEPAMGRPVLAQRLGPPAGAKPIEPVKAVTEVKPVEPLKPAAEVKPVEPVAPLKPILELPVDVKPAEPVRPILDTPSQPESLRSVLEALPPPSEEDTPRPTETPVAPVERPSGVAQQPEKPVEPTVSPLVGTPTMPLEAVAAKPTAPPTVETPRTTGTPTAPLVPVEVEVPPVKAEPPRPSERPTTVNAPVPDKKSGGGLLWVVLLLVLLAVAGAAYWFFMQKPQTPPTVGVRVTPVQPADVVRSFATPVVIKAAEPQPLKLGAAGKVAKVAAEGAVVLPDEVVVQLEVPAKLTKSMDLAKKSLDTWKKKLEAARGKPKLERDAQAKVADFEKTLAQLGEQQKGAQLLAPRAGTISKVLVQVHDAVTPGTEAVLFVDKGLGGELKVPALEAQGLKQGQDVQLLAAAGPVAAKLVAVTTEGDQATLRFALPEGAAVKSGDELKLAKAPLAQVVRLPASVLIDGSKVFVLQGNVASVRTVTVADRDGSDALVQGLEPGTKVIVSRVSELRDGMAVQPE